MNKNKNSLKDAVYTFDPIKAEEMMTTEIITVFEDLDSLNSDVDLSIKVDTFRTFITGLEFGYEIAFKSLGLEYTEDKKLGIFSNIDLIYEDWDNERMDNQDVWFAISSLIRALG